MKRLQSACQPIDYNSLTLIGIGGSAIVYGIDEATVLKEYYDETDECIAIERRVFDRLGLHRNIVQCLGEHNSRSIILERGQPLSNVTGHTGTKAQLEQKLQWIRDAAEGLRHMHRSGIIHADFGCKNMVLVDDRVKVVDFGGCSIDGSEALAGYNWYNRRGSMSPSLETDIFAFGCAVFEILTGKLPYHEFQDCPERDKIVQQLYAELRFPAVEQLPLRELMLGCWHGTLGSMDQVARCLDAACTVHKEIDSTASIVTHLVSKMRNCFRSTRLALTRQLEGRMGQTNG
ncbi:Calmodulin-binding receptor-like cytoplasmic kinase 3 [Metarhizium anisopliae]|nr:Calmodulin-binding receptor-like cytoplasmic kinase 3 [Metarhizium anisopliae]